MFKSTNDAINEFVGEIDGNIDLRSKVDQILQDLGESFDLLSSKNTSSPDRVFMIHDVRNALYSMRDDLYQDLKSIIEKHDIISMLIGNPPEECSDNS